MKNKIIKIYDKIKYTVKYVICKYRIKYNTVIKNKKYLSKEFVMI
jgi:hypothetical protein